MPRITRTHRTDLPAVRRRRAGLVGAVALTLSSLATFGPQAAAQGPSLSVDHFDLVPYPDRLIFNRIQNPADAAQKTSNWRKLRIQNKGDAPFTVTAITLSGPFGWQTPFKLPRTVQPGTEVVAEVRFIAQGGDLNLGSARVETTAGTRVVELAGFWQKFSEKRTEPSLDEIVRLFGYKVDVGGPDPAALNTAGRPIPVGSEVLTDYWQRADTTKPVQVVTLGSWHPYLRSMPVGVRQVGKSEATLFTIKGEWAQSALSKKTGKVGQAAATFTPSSSTFAFKVYRDYTDPALNDWGPDKLAGCSGECGHHIRAFPVRDRNGNLVPNKYILGHDWAAWTPGKKSNYDYQDTVLLVSNVRPA